MKVNLNQCNYSQANAVGSALKVPFFGLVRNIAIAATRKEWEATAKVVCRLALHCFIALIFIVPAVLALAVGRVITAFSASKLNHEKLSLAPPAMVVPQETAEEAAVDLNELSVKYKALGLDDLGKETSLERLCKWINFQNEGIYSDDPKKREMFCKEVSVFLRGIVNKMNTGEISKDKQRDILLELAEASKRCYPTWLTMAAKLYNEVNGRAETPEVKILRMVQDYKETLILEFAQNDVSDGQWHILNFVRNILGFDLGLNTSLNKFDPYAGDSDPVFGKALTKFLFLQRYENVDRLVTSIQANMNLQPYDMSIFEFLVKKLEENGFEALVDKKNGINIPADYIGAHFYDEEFKITGKGVNFMLKAMEILK
jgi:hypothetical protein